MNVPLQVKVPVDLMVDLRDRLKGVEAVQRRARERFEKKALAGGDVDKILAEQKALGEQGRRVTIQHLLRVFLARGMAEMANAKPEDLLALMATDEVVGGRPAEAKRGSRAA